MTGPHLALVGPSGSGKSRLAFDLARRCGDVEIVSVDSMCVYRYMDIGTAKPPPSERDAVPHHLLDVAFPWEEYTVARFGQAALAALADIEARGRRAIFAGGTGLYLRAVVDGLEIPPRYPPIAGQLSEEAEGPSGAAELYSRLCELDPLAAERILPGNVRRVVRALEVTLGSGRPFSSFGPGLMEYKANSRFAMVGIPLVDRARYDEIIAQRFVSWMEAGLLVEVRMLASLPQGLSRTARQALGYRELLAHLEGRLTLDEAIDSAVARTRDYGRRQWSWFRRDPRITWLDSSGDLACQVINLWREAPTPEGSQAAKSLRRQLPDALVTTL